MSVVAQISDKRRSDRADAEFLLGLAYLIGCGTAPSQVIARKHFEIGAERGSGLGEAAYGVSLWLGQGGAQDRDSGLLEIAKSDEKGNPFGKWLLALAKWSERTGDNGLAEAAKQFAPAANSAASRDVTTPASELTAQRAMEVRQYLELAAEAGDVVGINNLALAFHNRGDFRSSIRLWKVALEAKDKMILWPGATDYPAAEAALNLGEAYLQGLGTPRSKTDAARYFEVSGDLGNVTGAAHLGWMYEHGEGVERSQTKAVSFYREASAGGDYSSYLLLKALNYGP